MFVQRWGCRLAWSRLVDLGSIDSGSNPGSPTNQSNCEKRTLYCLVFFDDFAYCLFNVHKDTFKNPNEHIL